MGKKFAVVQCRYKSVIDMIELDRQSQIKSYLQISHRSPHIF